MKILQLSYRLPYPLKDGGAIGIFNLTKAYFKLGHQVTLLTFNTKKHFVAEENISSKLTSICKLVTVYHNTNLSPISALISLIKNKSYHISRFECRNYELKLIELLKNNSYDLIHIDGPFMASYYESIKKYSTAKIIVRAHNVEHFIWQKLAINASFPKNIYLNILANQMKKEEIQLWKKVDFIAAINQNELNYIEQFVGNGKVKMLAAGIFLEDFNQNQLSKIPLSTFYLGSMEWMPNNEAVDWFLKFVWPKVINKIPEATFYLAGRNMPKKYFDLQLKGLKVIGEVDNIAEFLSDKQLMIVPLKSGGGVRIKIIEAMALSNAIIATDLAADGLQITNEKNIIIANTEFEMANKIIELLNDSIKLDSLRNEARWHAEKTFNQVILMEDFLKSL
jgi:glycosyltransferase involved in cell wall biosynthesis